MNSIMTDSEPTARSTHEPLMTVGSGSGSGSGLGPALGHLLSLQTAAGGWEGEMVWNTMILSQHVIVQQIITGGRSLDATTRAQMIQHYRSARTPEGGWGMHRESPPYVYFTTLGYVALRLLGVPADDPLCADASLPACAARRRAAHPDLGQFWLSLCGLYDYAGVNPSRRRCSCCRRRYRFRPGTSLPHSLHLHGHRLSVRATLRRGSGADDRGAAQRALRSAGQKSSRDRLRCPPPPHCEE